MGRIDSGTLQEQEMSKASMCISELAFEGQLKDSLQGY